MKLYEIRYTSPIGEILAVTTGDALVALDFIDREPVLRAYVNRWFGEHTMECGRDPLRVARLLDLYFAGNGSALDTLHVESHGTEFQRNVWAALRRIRPGTTSSYRDLAHGVGRPSAVRAVASANAHNPIAVVVPCHRVIGSDGALRGYAGGVWRKRWLLEHEGRAGVQGETAVVGATGQ